MFLFICPPLPFPPRRDFYPDGWGRACPFTEERRAESSGLKMSALFICRRFCSHLHLERFLFFTPVKMRRLYTRPVRQAKTHFGSRTAGNKQMCRNTHTHKQTSKINRQQAFCITFLLKKKKKIYPVWIHKDNFELFECMNSLQGSTLVLIFNAGKHPPFLGR